MNERITSSTTAGGDVREDSEHRILPYKIQIRTTDGCGLLRACRPVTLLRKEQLYEEQDKNRTAGASIEPGR